MAADFSRIARTIADEIAAKPPQVVAAIGLLDEGATVPFIARYRKEVTGGLDDTQLRTARRAPDLSARAGIAAGQRSLESIRSQGKLTDELGRRSARSRPRPSSKTSTCPTSPSAAPTPRSRANAASARWPTPFSPIVRRCRSNSPRRSSPTRCRTPRQRSMARATFWSKALRKTRPCSAGCAPIMQGAGHPACQGGRRQGGGRREILRLFRPYRALGDAPSHRALAMLRGRNEEILTLDHRGRRRRHRAGEAGRADHRRRLRDRPGTGPATSGCCDVGRLDLAGEAVASR